MNLISNVILDQNYQHICSLFLYTGQTYARILEDAFLPSVRRILPHQQPVLVAQDNCPVHTSHVVGEWFNEHPDVVHLLWPSCSPDFNPMEHIWANMLDEWNNGDERTPDALENHCREVWEGIRQTPRLCENLIRSIPRRLNDCVAVGGGHTKY